MAVIQVSGSVTVQDLTLDKGDEFVVTGGGVEIAATGDIVIDGDIRFDAGEVNRTGISLKSTDGNIVVRGHIQAGDGGSPPAVSSGTAMACQANGGVGLSGGDITLTSDKGHIAFESGCRVVAGAGGRGAKATADGNCNKVTARSGGGGVGGNITVFAAKSIDVHGTLTGGHGGAGGEASAKGTADSTVVEATSLRGGNGGKVSLSVGANGSIGLDGSVHGGAGGDTLKAEAENGLVVHSVVLRAGDGGDVEVSAPRVGGLGADVVGGIGGNCKSSTAKTAKSARAAAQCESGGDGGTVNVPVLAAPADAGDSGTSTAVAAITDVHGAQMHQKSVPGSATEAAA